MNTKLTKKQANVLEFITDFMRANNYPPSYRDIMQGLGLSSVSAVAEHIDNLVALGVLKKTPGAARSLELVDFSYPEATALFQSKLATATDEEVEILEKAAIILGINLK